MTHERRPAAALLPAEPRIVGSPREQELTARFLAPAIADLEALFLRARDELDPILAQRQPAKAGKRYPLSQCLEISMAVAAYLRSDRADALTGAAGAGRTALRSFQRAGGSFRRVWGDLRGQYFQNAFQLGTLYVDVANDTVDPAKRKVEILPFDGAGLSPIRDFAHFARIARSYWSAEVFPNHVVPSLAPHCPLILIGPTGSLRLHDATDYMVSLARAGAFCASEVALRAAPLRQDVFDRAAFALRGAGLALARSPQEGRALALQACRVQRARRWHHAPEIVPRIARDAGRANEHLAADERRRAAEETPVQTITIDGTEYRLADLGEDARAQLGMLQATDAEITRLETQLAIARTARNAYANALRAALAKAEDGAVRRVG
ncbi:DUF6447 family protein [Salinarimonas ramus]|uniref:Uncharacterized protein n=1 Tax=Salinarimonas ramus TaxID=690164 RepID=A0A917QFY7_9HYPH|nr:DUF6447 family protein [Salinarimonas ramus]GGK47199.1 hypothetical protein GCM10011322_37790 [Salinarimonas ramus]